MSNTWLVDCGRWQSTRLIHESPFQCLIIQWVIILLEISIRQLSHIQFSPYLFHELFGSGKIKFQGEVKISFCRSSSTISYTMSQFSLPKKHDKKYFHCNNARIFDAINEHDHGESIIRVARSSSKYHEKNLMKETSEKIREKSSKICNRNGEQQFFPISVFLFSRSAQPKSFLYSRFIWSYSIVNNEFRKHAAAFT